MLLISGIYNDFDLEQSVDLIKLLTNWTDSALGNLRSFTL